ADSTVSTPTDTGSTEGPVTSVTAETASRSLLTVMPERGPLASLTVPEAYAKLPLTAKPAYVPLPVTPPKQPPSAVGQASTTATPPLPCAIPATARIGPSGVITSR